MSLNGHDKTLDGLSAFSSLTSLSVDSYELTDIRGLASLTNLTSLSLEGCDMVTDYSVLYTLKNLQDLSLRDTSIKEIGFISEMPDLSSFTLDDSSVLDLSPLADCAGLTSLVLADCSEAADFSSVDSLTGLTSLELSLYSTQKMPALNTLTRLEKLAISGAGDISFLASMPQLKELSIYGCDVSRYDAFSALTELSVSGDKLSDLSFTEWLPLLETLDISENYFSDLRPLDKLTHLKTVYCADNTVSKYPASERLLLIE